MESIDNSNNFYIKPPNFSWLNLSYPKEFVNEINSLQKLKSQQSINGSKNIKEEKIESRSQSFIELTKLLTDDCQYGLLDEYAGTKEERDQIKKDKELKKKQKEEEEKADRELEEKIRNEYVVINKDEVEREIEAEETQKETEEEKGTEETEENQDDTREESKKRRGSSDRIVEKIETNIKGLKKLFRIPFSAPVRSVKTEMFSDIEKFKRRGSLDENIIRINGSYDGTNRKDIIRPLKDVSILSNNYITTIEIKPPVLKEEGSVLLKDFLKDDSSKDENSTGDDEIFSSSNKIEKFKRNESSTSLNVLLENIDIKCDSYESLAREGSLDSLESIDIDNKKGKVTAKSDNSWISNISKSFQSWMNLKNDYDINYFTKTDKEGNVQVLSINSIMELYNFDYNQAASIHEYVSATLPKFPNNITGYTKYIEKINKDTKLKENRKLELIYKTPGISPIITSDLAQKLQAQLPINLSYKYRWTMQYSLSSENNENVENQNDIMNLSNLLYASNNRGPCLIIIQDENSHKFGAFIDQELRNDAINFYGSRNCFLWKYNNKKLEVYRTKIEDCKSLICSNSEFLAIGGLNDGQFALYIDKRLKNGHSYRNKSFNSKSLASFDDFYISELELWTFE